MTAGDSIVKPFDSPDATLGRLDAAAAATVIAAASDVALILDRDGVIRDFAFGSTELSKEDFAHWLGRPWSETVTVESRPKIEALLRDAAARTVPRSRQVNHPSTRGVDLPVSYSAIQVGTEGRVVAVGRDLRSIAALQQRLVEAQQAMERDYWRLRHVETRYRLLFKLASEPVLMIDAGTLKVVEANPSAAQCVGAGERRLPGRALLELFDAEGAAAVQTMLASVRVAGRADDVRARLGDRWQQFVVRHGNTLSIDVGGQFKAGDLVAVYFIRAVGEAQRACLRIEECQWYVVGHARGTMHLDGPVDHLAGHIGRHDLDHRDVLARRLVAGGVHLPRGVQHQEPRLVDQDA